MPVVYLGSAAESAHQQRQFDPQSFLALRTDLEFLQRSYRTACDGFIETVQALDDLPRFAPRLDALHNEVLRLGSAIQSLRARIYAAGETDFSEQQSR